MSLIQFSNKFLIAKNIVLGKHLFKILQRAIWVIVPDIIFRINFEHQKNMSFSWRFLKDPGKGNMSQTVMSQMQSFNKRLNMKKYRSLGGNFCKILKKTIWVKLYCPWYNFF